MAETIYDKLATYYDEKIVPPLRQAAVARKLVSRDSRVSGEDVYEVEVMKTGTMNPAIIEYKIPDDVARDMIGVTTEKIKIPFLAKGFEVPRQDIVLFKKRGITIDTVNAIEAAQTVLDLEESYLIQGWAPDGSNYQVKGLYQSAGNTVSTSYDFGTYGNAYSAISDAIQAMDDDNIRGENFNVTLNPTQANELRKSRHSTSAIKELPDVIDLINSGNGQASGGIFVSKHITAGTGMVTPVDPAMKYFCYFEPQAVRTHTAFDPILGEKISPVYGLVYELLVPYVKQPNAVVALTGI